MVEGIQGHYERMPAFKEKTLGSFLFSFTINATFNATATLGSCAASGGVSAIASVVDAAVNPFFADFVKNDENKISWEYFALKNIVVITALSALTFSAAPQAVVMSAVAFGYVFFTWYCADENGMYDANHVSMHPFPFIQMV